MLNGQLAVYTHADVRLIVTWSVSPDRVADCSSGARESEYPNSRSVVEEDHSRGSVSLRWLELILLRPNMARMT